MASLYATAELPERNCRMACFAHLAPVIVFH